MELQEKLKILSDSAKYDVSCSSSGSNRKNVKGGIGNAAYSGICHSWSDDGRCISLLKILYSNECVYDCVYCVNRVTNDVPRASFTPREVAELTINFYRRNYIEGLFLSSAIVKNPDHTMEGLTEVVRILREEHRFNGYIHLKGIPGADAALITKAGHYVDRMSVNIELPSNEGLKLLAPQKKKENILRPMGQINRQILQSREERKRFKGANTFVPAGQSTQLMVGATKDHDYKILKLTEGLYNSYQLKRVYYSAYVPVLQHPNLPKLINPPTVREHRLYQADWLLRFYGFEAGELLDEENPNFDNHFDPKTDWALRNINLFPIEINKAEYEMLLRIPGIGIRSAQRIITARRMAPVTYDGLKKIGVVMKRAQHFMTCQGKYYGEVGMRVGLIKQFLLPKETKPKTPSWQDRQLSFFTDMAPYRQEAINSIITGEL
ncbi:putative DNA modification/repair radical SAM protein [Alkaliphilus hydrothermalis]|uniref:DNA modification/repair radical SAM protein n=1 Tax=Alkaliphilus hydrothermalis TaxID=1482730 RepID=A0ABS2NQ65_9FIRM|nr:putative DNA modification/repair radical SAM protein [Alkaliphilus hydrothermalis]MBM7615073.1 putative DNA modification/repair radical SAM protein [Alkaliphilus hydrothermalis]